MRNIKKLRDQKGFTLVEIAIILTIVGLVIGGIWLAASTVYNNMRKSQLAQDTIQIVQNLRNLYAGQATIGAAALTNAIAIQSGVIPSNLVTGATTARNAFDSTAGAGNGTVITGAANATVFTITYTAIPQDACIELLSGRLAQNQASAARIGLNTANALVPPITPTQAAGACAAPNGNVVLVFNLN